MAAAPCFQSGQPSQNAWAHLCVFKFITYFVRCFCLYFTQFLHLFMSNLVICGVVAALWKLEELVSLWSYSQSINPCQTIKNKVTENTMEIAPTQRLCRVHGYVLLVSRCVQTCIFRFAGANDYTITTTFEKLGQWPSA